MKPTPKRTKKSRITRLTVARLYNLGNYEHVRYEITSEIPRGGSVKQTMLDTFSILAGLKPIKRPINFATAKAVVAKDQSAMTEYEKAHFEEYAEAVKEHAGLVARRNDALDMLDDVGGVSVHTDAKRNWEDNDDAPF